MTGRTGRSFIAQLRKRKVFRVAIAYIIVAWVVMQVGELVFEALQMPEWAVSLLVIIVLLGFPVALVLGWAFEITPEGIKKDSEGASRESSGDYLEGAPSIAVLPFDDMSEQQDQGYFCEGIAEEILNALDKIANLRVASRVASFQLGNRNVEIPRIGQLLKVQSVLEGSVRKSGDRLRITAQLVKTSDGFHLWSRQFDRKLEDIFDIQAEIADAIASSLSLSLKRTRADQQQQVDPKAYDFFLRGLSYFAEHDSQNLAYARQMFRQAIDIEPGYGRAWAGLAYTYGFDYLYHNATDVNLKEARRTSKKALQLAPDLSESHVSSGIAFCMSKRYAEAEAEFEQAVKLDPKNYEAWYLFGRAKVHEGDLKRALALFERAAKVRPDDYQSVLLQAQLHVSMGNQAKAMEVTSKGIERVRAVLELNPDDLRARNMGAFALLRLGEKKTAEKWMAESIRRAPEDSIIQYNAACFYGLSGDVEKCLEQLENCAFKVGNVNREWLENDSDLDSVRGHPRFEEILRRHF
jgi:TolB-like protein/Flp pilus assembly protein TadD